MPRNRIYIYRDDSMKGVLRMKLEYTTT